LFEKLKYPSFPISFRILMRKKITSLYFLMGASLDRNPLEMKR